MYHRPPVDRAEGGGTGRGESFYRMVRPPNGTMSTEMQFFSTQARRNIKAATGMALKERARRGVVRRWVASVARQAQVKNTPRAEEGEKRPGGGVERGKTARTHALYTFSGFSKRLHCVVCCCRGLLDARAPSKSLKGVALHVYDSSRASCGCRPTVLCRQVRFRESRPPALECCVCHQAFRLYGDYWRHFGGGRLVNLETKRTSWKDGGQG